MKNKKVQGYIIFSSLKSLPEKGRIFFIRYLVTKITAGLFSSPYVNRFIREVKKAHYLVASCFHTCGRIRLCQD